MSATHNHSDPFDESAAEVRAFLEQAQAALSRAQLINQPTGVRAEGAVQNPRFLRAVSECRDALSHARDELDLLDTVVRALKSGRSRSGQIPPEVVAQREDFVEEAQGTITSLTAQLNTLSVDDVAETLRPSHRSAMSSRSGVTRSPAPEESDAAFHVHVEEQRRLRESHDAALDRITFGVEGLRDKASLLGGQLEEDERHLSAALADVQSVQQRLNSAIRRVDGMLTKMSWRSRCGLIVVLVALLLVLIFLITL